MGIGHETRLLPGAQRIGVTVWQPLDDSPCGDVESVERASCNVIAGSVGARNRIPVRVATRVAEHAVEAVEKAIGDRMFQDLGLFVDLIPGKAKGLVQVGFEQTVAAYHAQSDGAPLRG